MPDLQNFNMTLTEEILKAIEEKGSCTFNLVDQDGNKVMSIKAYKKDAKSN